MPQQRECRSDLTAMEEDAYAFELKSPAILVIGAVAAGSWREDQKIAACGSSYRGPA
ncbi:hypothetical protein D3C75_1384840 [compost metagenome]